MILGFKFLSWWYGEEFARLFAYFGKFFVYLYDLFSVEICLKTLFSVWRRDIIDYRNLGIREIFQAWTLNTASRLVGFVVKAFTILGYLIVTTVFIAAALFSTVFWLAFPAVIVGLIFYGIKTSSGF